MNRFRFTTLALALAGPLLAGCQSAEPDPAAAEPAATPIQTVSDPAAIRTEIEALTARYQAAARAGDVAAIQALYADDAVLHPDNGPAVRGRAAVDAHLAASHAEPTDLTFDTIDVVASEGGDLAYEVGTTVWPDGPGKYVTIYRRTADGWQIVADTWSHNAPQAAATN